MNGRGNLLDAIPALIILFVIVIIVFVGMLFIDNINDAFMNTPGVPAVASDLSNDIDTQAGWTFDFIIVMLLVTLPLVSAMLAYFNDIPPYFFFATLGVLLIVIIFANAFNDSYVSFSTSSTATTNIANRLPMTDYIMSHLVIYSLLSAAIIMFGVFMKPKRGL